jgi:hypothetical protein
MASFVPTNAPQNLNMNSFLSAINREEWGGLAKSCRFIAVIRPQGDAILKQSGLIKDDLHYLCEAAEFPGRGLQSVDLRYYGPNFKMPYQTSYEDLNMTFLCRTEGYERQFFDDWMEIINPTKTFDFEYRDNYRSQIEIYHYGDVGSSDGRGNVNHIPKYSFTIHEAYPTLVNAQPVTWADDQFLRLGITFTYSWWSRNGWDPKGTNIAGFNASYKLVPSDATGFGASIDPQSRI